MLHLEIIPVQTGKLFCFGIILFNLNHQLRTSVAVFAIDFAGSNNPIVSRDFSRAARGMETANGFRFEDGVVFIIRSS